MDDFLTLFDLRGGRTGQHQSSLGEDTNQVEEAVNVDYFYSKCGNRRWGSVAADLTGQGAQTSHDGSLLRHVPGGDELLSEMWAFNADATTAGNQVQRYTSSGWGTVTVLDALKRALAPNTVSEVRGVSFNSKLFVTYKANATMDRLHVYDGSTLRRVGIAAGAAVPGIGVGAGAVTDSRAYKVAWTKQVGGVTTYRSELTGYSAVQGLAAQQATITRPTAPGEGETHWETYAFSDDDNYATGYLIATTVIGTAASTDNNVTLSGDAPPEIGLNVPPTSWKYIMVHGNRLLGAGSHETGLNNRVWFTPPLGSSDKGDDERVPNTLLAKNRLDFDENDGGIITGFGGVINGTPIVFKRNRTYRMQPTGQAANPYMQVPQPISNTIGCIRQETVVQAEDENGQPCVYWLSTQGPYRYGARGLEYLGRDIEDYWLDSARGTRAAPHGVYHADKKQVWWWIGLSTTTNLKTNLILKFHVQHGRSTSNEGVRGGWVLHNGASAQAYASVMFSRDVSFGSGTGYERVPFTSCNKYSPRTMLKCDDTSTINDNGEFVQSYIQTRPYALAGFGNRCGTQSPMAVMRDLTATSGVVAMELIRDYGEETVYTDTVLSYEGTVRAFRFANMNASMVNARVIQLRYGDVGALSAGAGDTWWGVEAIAIQRDGENRA